MSTQSITQPKLLNGINVDDVLSLIGQVADAPSKGAFQFRLNNHWIGGDLNRSEICDFSILDGQTKHRAAPFIVDNAEPIAMAGNDKAPTPVEYVLHALAGCLTSTLIYHAAANDIEIKSVSSSLEGDIDVRGFFGLSNSVRKGFNAVRVRMSVNSDADVKTLKELAMYSPVYDIVSKSLPVNLVIEKQ